MLQRGSTFERRAGIDKRVDAQKGGEMYLEGSLLFDGFDLLLPPRSAKQVHRRALRRNEMREVIA